MWNWPTPCPNRPTLIARVALVAMLTWFGPSNLQAAGEAAPYESAQSLAKLVKKIGRVPDVSEQGGACGGIMVHDWTDEKLRVISLGDSVQSVSVIPHTSQQPAREQR